MQEAYMRVAIEKVKDGIAAGQVLFGAVIVCGHAVIAAAYNVFNL